MKICPPHQPSRRHDTHEDLPTSSTDQNARQKWRLAYLINRAKCMSRMKIFPISEQNKRHVPNEDLPTLSTEHIYTSRMKIYPIPEQKKRHVPNESHLLWRKKDMSPLHLPPLSEQRKRHVSNERPDLLINRAKSECQKFWNTLKISEYE